MNSGDSGDYILRCNTHAVIQGYRWSVRSDELLMSPKDQHTAPAHPAGAFSLFLDSWRDADAQEGSRQESDERGKGS